MKLGKMLRIYGTLKLSRLVDVTVSSRRKSEGARLNVCQLNQ